MGEESGTGLEGVEERLDSLKSFLNRYLTDAGRPRDCCWEAQVAAGPAAVEEPRLPGSSDVLNQQRQRHSQAMATLRERIEEQEREIAALTREHSALVSSRQS